LPPGEFAVTVRHKTAFPVVTFLLATGSLCLFLLPDSTHLFVYDRNRVLTGDVWRLVTGHLVHFSWSHTAYNIVLLALAGSWIESRDRFRYLWLITLTVLASGLYFLIMLPDLERYGGLSGLVSATVVYLSLYGIRYYRHARLIWYAILFLFAVKVSYEIMVREAIFVSPDIIPFEVVPSVHVAGGLIAAVLFYAFPRHLPSDTQAMSLSE
jgi:rhomboid family GlyGly-CTERM serine protease